MQTDEPSLTKRVAVGATWLVAGRWSIRLIGLFSTVILARLLTPEDYGIVVLAGLVVAILDTLTDFRFGQALVHYQDASVDEYNTAWTFNVIRGVVVAILLVGGASIFAAIFKEPRLVAVFQVLGLIAILDGLQNIGTIYFTKDIRFDRDFALRIGQKLSTFFVSITLAYLWQSYWALVAGMVAGTLARLILSYVMHPFRPRFHISAWRRLYAFSAWLMAGQTINLINQRLEQFFIGGFLSTKLVGVYNLAYELASMATSELVSPAAQALFPGFAKIAENRVRLREAYVTSVQFVVAIATPLGIGLALVAKEFIPIVLGSKWTDAVMPLQVLSVMFSVSVLAMASTGLLPALGRTRDVFIIDFTQFVARLPVTAAIIWQYGIVGAVWARFGFGIWWVIHSMWVTSRAIDLSFRHLMTVLWRSYAATILMIISVLLAGNYLFEPDTLQTSIASSAIHLVTKAIIGATTYIMSHLLLWHLLGRPNGPERRILDLIYSKFRRRR